MRGCRVWVAIQAGMWGAGGLTDSHLQGRAPGGGCRPGAGVQERRGACCGSVLCERQGRSAMSRAPSPPAASHLRPSRPSDHVRGKDLGPTAPELEGAACVPLQTGSSELEDHVGLGWAAWLGCAHLYLKAQLTIWSSPTSPAVGRKHCARTRQGPALPYWSIPIGPASCSGQ